MTTRVWVALVVVGALCAGCSSSPSSREGAVQYGSDGPAEPATTASSEPPPTSAPRGTVTTASASPPTSPPSPSEPTPDDRSAPRTPTTRAARTVCEGDDEGAPNDTHLRSGSFLLRLTVADRLCFGSADGIRMELAVRNVSDEPVAYESSKYVIFRIEPTESSGPAWTDGCGSGEQQQPPGPALMLEPGESLRFIGDYPNRPGTSDSSSPCHVLREGIHRVLATFRWCPNPSATCGESSDLGAKPVLIQIQA